MLNKVLLIFFIFQANLLFAQEFAVGTWQDYLPYSDAVSVTEANEVIYCATKSALFTYDKSDFSIERLSIVNGLSDIGLSKVRFNGFNNKIVVAYTNGNVDIIDKNKNITNLPAIKTTSIAGSKKINHIYFQGNLAYLSTGFGIVVLNMEKIEIVETYFFGPLGNSIITNAVTIDGSNIYAATDQGVYVANINSANLIDYNAWTLLPELGTLKYSSVVSFSNRLFASLDLSSDTSGTIDTLYYNDGGVWQKFISSGMDIKQLVVSNGVLSVVQKSGISLYNLSLNNTENILSVNGFWFNPNDVFTDDKGLVWAADNFSGLIKIRSSTEREFIIPNSSASSNVYQLDFSEDELWVVSGGDNIFLQENLVNHKSNNEWRNMDLLINDANGNSTFDMISVAINPNNSSNVFTGSRSSGLYEYNDDKVVNIYNAQNSALDSFSSGSTAISALSFDEDGNLWTVSSFSTNILAVKTADNNWENFSFTGMTSSTSLYPAMLIDQNGYKWIIKAQDNAVIVFDDNKTIEDKSDDRMILNDNIPGAALHSIVEDKDGEIWIGSDEGVAVFYNPSSVFDEDIEAEQIFIEQDGQTQILLETEVVTAITIDGANRKWIGTQTSGVYLMSEDGTTQIEHFTKENSPLFSNSIFDIVIDPKTGEVYIGTEKGLISYKGTATEGRGEYDNVYVYPNPVKPDFTGKIAIRGLIKDTDVRITDISGNIVYQTTSLGGQAVWDGRDFNGKKVQTGVYMIFNGSKNGDQKAAAKILIYH